MTAILVSNANGQRADTVMERDLRITGSFRGQSTNPVAPKGFEVNNPWKVCSIGVNVCATLTARQLEKRII